MADIRFQVEINGKPLCIAGVEGFAILTAGLDYIKRNPQRYDEVQAQSPPIWSTTLEEWSRESLGINLHSVSDDGMRHTSWIDRELNVGDEITIRILGPGPADTPEHVIGPDGSE